MGRGLPRRGGGVGDHFGQAAHALFNQFGLAVGKVEPHEIIALFIGKEAALAEKASGAKKKLVTLVVNTTDFDVCNDEAVLVGDKAVGYVSSGGYAHALGKSMAFAYVPTELASAGTQVDVEINGARYAAEVQAGALYDPKGLRMRS